MILKDQEIIKLCERSAICPGRLQLGDYSIVEQAIDTWFKEVRTTEVLESEHIIQAMAKESICLTNIDNFEDSARWLFPF
jgi:hypothetical protein